jgi:hypothetical protein
MKQIDFESKISVAFVIVSIVLTILLTSDIWWNILPDH